MLNKKADWEDKREGRMLVNRQNINNSYGNPAIASP